MSKQREALKLVLAVGYTSTESPTYKIIKEALAEPEQEPVAWAHQPPGMSRIYSIEPIPGPDSIPLYATPPSRKPLTDDEVMLLANASSTQYWGTEAHILRLARSIERAHGIGD